MIDRDEYDADYKELQAILAKEQPKAPSKNLKKLESLLKIDISEMYSKLDREHKQRFWRSICKEIVITFNREVKEIIFK